MFFKYVTKWLRVYFGVIVPVVFEENTLKAPFLLIHEHRISLRRLSVEYNELVIQALIEALNNRQPIGRQHSGNIKNGGIQIHDTILLLIS